MELEKLTESISEHIGKMKISYIPPDKIVINGCKIQIEGNLAKSARFTLRFRHTKMLLQMLRDEGLLLINDQALEHILNRYRKLKFQSLEY